MLVFFFKQKTAYEMRISDWSSDVCSSDLDADVHAEVERQAQRHAEQCRVREAVAEIGHPPPHDETAERSPDECYSDAGEDRPHHEIVQHGRCASVEVEGAMRQRHNLAVENVPKAVITMEDRKLQRTALGKKSHIGRVDGEEK